MFRYWFLSGIWLFLSTLTIQSAHAGVTECADEDYDVVLIDLRLCFPKEYDPSFGRKYYEDGTEISPIDFSPLGGPQATRPFWTDGITLRWRPTTRHADKKSKMEGILFSYVNRLRDDEFPMQLGLFLSSPNFDWEDMDPNRALMVAQKTDEYNDTYRFVEGGIVYDTILGKSYLSYDREYRRWYGITCSSLSFSGHSVYDIPNSISCLENRIRIKGDIALSIRIAYEPDYPGLEIFHLVSEVRKFLDAFHYTPEDEIPN